MPCLDGYRILNHVASKLLRGHPFYLYAYAAGTRPYLPFIHQVLLLSDNALRPVVRILIGDEVGLGKTAMAALTLKLLEARAERERREHRFLILVPRVLVDQWASELMRVGVGPEKIHRLTSGGDLDRYAAEGWPPGYYVGSLQLLRRRGHAEKVATVDWDAIVVDEAHNVGLGVSFQRLTMSYRLVFTLTRPAERSVLLLSATPHRGKTKDYLARLLLLVPEISLDDIQSLVTKLDDVKFYQSTHSTLVYRRTKELVNKLEKTNIFKPAYMKAVIVKAGDEERQFENILTAFLKRKLEEWGRDIWSRGNPKGLLLALIRKRASSSVYAAQKTLSTIVAGLASRSGRASAEDLEALSSLLATDYSELGDTDPDDIIAQALGSLPPGLFSPRDLEELRMLAELASEIAEKEESKVRALRDIVSRHIQRGERIVVFTEYRDTVEYLYTRLKDMSIDGYRVRVACVSGSPAGPCSREKVEELKQRLEVGDVDLVLATDVVAEGLNLQAASVLVHYDVPWSPVKLEQRMGRVWRLGQKNPVTIYTLFRNMGADLALVERLYTKILAIKKAMGTARAMIGESAEVYAEGEFVSAEKIYMGGAPGASDAVADALGDVGELEIARAMIEGRLDEIAMRIIDRINKLRYEIASKKIYPTGQDPRELSERARNLLGVDGPAIARIMEQAAKISRLTGGPPPRDEWEAIIAYRSLVALLARVVGGRGLAAGTYRSPAIDRGEKLIIVPARIERNGKIIHEESVGILFKDEIIHSVLIGPFLLDKLLEVAERGAEKVSHTPSLTPKERILVSVRAKKVLIERHSRMEKLYRQLIDAIANAYGRPIDPSGGISDVSVTLGNTTEYIVIESGSSCEPPQLSAYRVGEELPGRLVSEATATQAHMSVDYENEDVLKRRLSIEARALMLVKQYEIAHGRDPVDVHMERSYDIESRNPFTLEVERYIEVKAHRGMDGTIELTEKEYEFALRHRDKYWLYLVVGLDTDKPKIITIHDPIGKLNLRRMKKKQVVEREETRYVAEVNIEEYLAKGEE